RITGSLTATERPGHQGSMRRPRAVSERERAPPLSLARTELLNVAFAGLGGRLHDTIRIRRAIVRVAVHDRGTEVRDAIHGDAPPGTTERSEQPCTFAPIERVDALHDARVVGDGQARTVADFAARSVALQVVVGAPDRSAVLSAVGVDRHEVPTLAVDARLL